MAVLILLCPLAGCGKGAAENDIVILFTTDVHCEVDGTIGYASLAAYKKELQSKTEYVTLVDCGDAIDGGYIGTVSKGEYIIDLMNAVGYDFCVLGNHEFATAYSSSVHSRNTLMPSISAATLHTAARVKMPCPPSSRMKLSNTATRKSRLSA